MLYILSKYKEDGSYQYFGDNSQNTKNTIQN